MTGCTPDNDNAIDYFEARFFSVEKVVEKDNDFQESIKKILSEDIEEDELAIEEFDSIYHEISNNYDSLKLVIEQQKSNQLPIIEDDENLQKSYISVLNAYEKVVKDQYKNMLELISMEEEVEGNNEKFKELYDTASDILNERLTIFYEAAKMYGDSNNLEINWEE